ncbi:hypothetical protein Tco_0347835 [Tanacetum coccineum]
MAVGTAGGRSGFVWLSGQPGEVCRVWAVEHQVGWFGLAVTATKCLFVSFGCHHSRDNREKKRNPFIPIEDRVPKAKYPPFENLFEAEVVYNPFLDLPFPMADDQPMWGNNRAVAPTPGAAIVAVELGDNFSVKGHRLSMIKDRQFDGRS